MRAIDLPAALVGCAVILGLLHGGAARAAEDAPAAGPAPAAAAEVFPVMEFRVLHNTVMSTRQVESAVYPFLGPQKTLADVEAARSALEKAYHSAGYSSVFVDIPEQAVADGVVRLSVTEGRVGALHVTGERYVSGRAIRAAVPALAPGTVPYFPEVQRQINDLNRKSADMTVVPVLKAGQSPGELDANLKVKDAAPLHASVELNNRYTPDTSPLRLNLNLSYTNLFQTFQSLALGYQVAPQNASESEVYSANYGIPLGPGGPSLALYAVKTNSDVATVGTLSVIGKGHIYGARYIQPLPTGEGPGFSQSVILGSDYKDFGQNVLLTEGGGLETPIHYVNWSVVYDALFETPHTHTLLDAGANFGITGIANSPEEFELNRYLAQPNYFYLRLNATHERLLTHGFSLALRISGQYTPEPLISNEQFAIGGAESVRGYLESEALGDFGLSGSIEVRSPALPRLVALGAREAYLYLFTDGGFVKLNDPLPTQDARTNIWSFGGGMRLTALRGLDLAWSIASAREATVYTHSDDVRFLFDVRYQH